MNLPVRLESRGRRSGRTATLKDNGEYGVPLFEYRCDDCRQEFELLVRRLEDVNCPRCGSRDLEKLLSATASSVGAARSSVLPVASDCPPGDAPCGPACCRLP